MSATPELDAAIRNEIGCFNAEECGWPNCRSCKPRVDVILRVLRSLATLTPEVIEAMARALADAAGKDPDAPHIDRAGRTFPYPEWRRWLGEAIIAHAALWAHILGEAKPADLPPDLSTRGNRP